MALKYTDATFVMVGHSMGGSIAARATEQCKTELDVSISERVVGLQVIDVVEGTALDAQPFMESIVKKMPKKFDCINDGIEWATKSRTQHNKESAKVSIPPQQVRIFV